MKTVVTIADGVTSIRLEPETLVEQVAMRELGDVEVTRSNGGLVLKPRTTPPRVVDIRKHGDEGAL